MGHADFTHEGKNIAGMAAFTGHCAVTVHGEGRQGEGEGMGSYGKIASLGDLPDDAELAAKLLAAKERIERGGTAARPRSARTSKPEIAVPQDFAATLREMPNAQVTFDRFTPAQRRDYLEWITGAKQDATRQRRIVTAVEWLAEGKRRNWKYEKC